MHELPFIKATVYPVPLMGQFAARYVAGQPNYDEGLWRAVNTLVHLQFSSLLYVHPITLNLHFKTVFLIPFVWKNVLITPELDFPRSFVVQYSAVQCSTAQYGTVQYGTVWYSTVQYGTVWYSTVQYGTVRYSMVQYGTVWYSMVQYGTVWYSMVQSQQTCTLNIRFSSFFFLKLSLSMGKCCTLQSHNLMNRKKSLC